VYRNKEDGWSIRNKGDMQRRERKAGRKGEQEKGVYTILYRVETYVCMHVYMRKF
jgi:hypothetical protein